MVKLSKAADPIKEISAREKMKAFSKLKDENFEEGMYSFTMFMLDYFSRVKKDLQLDYESFMIIQLVVTHVIYESKMKSKQKKSFFEMETLWDKIVKKYSENNVLSVIEESSKILRTSKNNKLTISSICLSLNLPKETVRRKVAKLSKLKILSNNGKFGINIGEGYKKIFSNFVPNTVLQFSKLLRFLERKNVLKPLLEFKS